MAKPESSFIADNCDIVKWPLNLVGERPLRIGYDSGQLID
jgi:hypothetical protein